MLEIKNLKVSVWKKEILKDISISFEIWKNYCLLWKNGSWKSSLSKAITWHPNYKIKSWSIILDWEDITNISASDKSKKWIFLSFQNVPEIEWIRLIEYLRTINNIHINSENPDAKPISPFLFKRFITKLCNNLDISLDFLDRDLNVGFSGWEKRKIEILQMQLIKPKFIILDEIDSGLDLTAFKRVAELLSSINSKDNSIIIITHYFNILDYIDIDKAYVLKDWEVLIKWWKEVIENIKINWYT